VERTEKERGERTSEVPSTSSSSALKVKRAAAGLRGAQKRNTKYED
jgi:hypothetical protein